MNFKKINVFCLALSVAIIFTACGGNGSGSGDDGSESESGDDGSGSSSLTITGNAVDGYLRNALVCVDTNNNLECDDNESFSKTTSTGGYTLSVDKDQALASIIAYGGVDDGTGQRFNGILKAPLDKGAVKLNITPLTTLIAAQIERTGGDAADETTIAEATQKVADTFGMETALLNADPVALAKAGDNSVLKKALQIQKTIEVMAQAEEKRGKTPQEAMQDVAEALAKQCDGSIPKDVATIAMDITTDGELDITAAVEVAAYTAAMAATIEDSNSSDVQTVAEIVVEQIELAVDTGIVVDGAGSVISTIDLNVTDINTTENAIALANIDRMLGLIGYTDILAQISDANRTSMLGLNITSVMTIDEFKDLLPTSLDTDFAAELAQMVADTKAKEQAYPLLDLELWGVDLGHFNTYDFTTGVENKIFLGIAAQKVFLDSNGTGIMAELINDPQTNSWINFDAVVEPSDSNYTQYIWSGTEWVYDQHTGADNSVETFKANSDGSITFYSNASGVDYPEYTVKLVSTTELESLTKTVSGAYYSDSGLSVATTFGAGAKEYVLDFSSVVGSAKITYHADGNGGFEGFQCGFNETTFEPILCTTLAGSIAYQVANPKSHVYAFGESALNNDGTTSWTQIYMAANGILNSYKVTQDANGSFLPDVETGPGGTYETVTIDGREVVRFNVDPAYNPWGGTSGLMVGHDGHVFVGSLPSSDMQSFQMTFYSSAAAEDIRNAIYNSGVYTFPSIQSLIDQNFSYNY